ncbi:MAG: hypothetical protein IJU40_07770, partial [Desulfovibrionaceae bacterium]|nr:hypothetical protein [Desulfovibrionaceae bacterium]
MFTEQDSARQDAVFAELKEEFTRLEQKENELRKLAGISAQDEVPSLDELPPDVRKEYEEAQAKAKREGEARATQFKNGSLNSAGQGHKA